MTLLVSKVPDAGVRIAVHVIPPSEEDKLDNEAFVTVRSAVAKSVMAFIKVKVTEALSPKMRLESLIVIGDERFGKLFNELTIEETLLLSNTVK